MGWQREIHRSKTEEKTEGLKVEDEVGKKINISKKTPTLHTFNKRN